LIHEDILPKYYSHFVLVDVATVVVCFDSAVFYIIIWCNEKDKQTMNIPDG